MDCSNIAEKAGDVINSTEFGILTTIDSNGHPQSRAMANVGTDEDMTVYFITARDSTKCAHIAANPKVSVFWYLTDGWRQAHLKGEAKVTDDRSLRQRFWSHDYQKYFPGGVDDPTYVLIVIKPEKLAYASSMESTPECADF